MSFIVGNKLSGFISLGLLVIFSLMIRFRKRLVKFSYFIMFTNVIATNAGVLLFIISGVKSQDDVRQFTIIWSLASVHYMLVTQFQHFSMKCLLVITSLAMRYGLLSSHYNRAIISNFLVICVIIDSFVLVMYYHTEKKERRIFRDFYDHRLELSKFKELLENYLPQNVTILKSKDQSPLFSNKAFLKLFPTHNDDGSPSSSMEKNTTISQKTLLAQPIRVQSNIHTLNLKIHAVRQLEKLEKKIDICQKVPNLKAFIQNIIDKEFFCQQVFSLQTSMMWQGVQRSFDAIVTPIIWDQEEAVAIVLNETTYQENILALKVADRNKDLVIATVSHELRTPLNGIIGILQIVETKALQPEVLEYLSLCKDNAILLLSLVNSMLDLQQIRDGKLKLNLSNVNIAKVAKDTIQLFYYQAAQKQIFLNLEVNELVPRTIYTDDGRVRQILINLIGNALKFTITGGVTVQITPDVEDTECIRVTVADTGVGIKEEDKDRLFKMYGKSEEVLGINKNGVGLGLTISDGLAKTLGGMMGENRGIEMESRLGVGSRFGFKLLKDYRITENKATEHIIRFPEETDGQGIVCNIPSEYEPICKANKGKEEEEEDSSGVADVQAKLFKHMLIKRISLDDLSSFPRIKKMISNDNLVTTRAPTHEEDGRISSRFKTYRGPDALPCEQVMPDYPASLSKTKGEILIVDDNPFNLMIAKNFVESLGYQAKTTISGQEAIYAVKNNERSGETFKCILMDCQMPIMDGFETTATLLGMMRNNQVKQVPIIALTANNSKDDIKRCLDCGMADHLAKPLFIGDLKRVISKLNV